MGGAAGLGSLRSWGLSNPPGRALQVPRAETKLGVGCGGNRFGPKWPFLVVPGVPRALAARGHGVEKPTCCQRSPVRGPSAARCRERGFLWATVRPARFLSPKGKFLLLILTRVFPWDPRRRWSLKFGGGGMGGKYHYNIFFVKFERGILDTTPKQNVHFPCAPSSRRAAGGARRRALLALGTKAPG